MNFITCSIIKILLTTRQTNHEQYHMQGKVIIQFITGMTSLMPSGRCQLHTERTFEYKTNSSQLYAVHIIIEIK